MNVANKKQFYPYIKTLSTGICRVVGLTLFLQNYSIYSCFVLNSEEEETVVFRNVDNYSPNETA
jgi:hypothetical protein